MSAPIAYFPKKAFLIFEDKPHWYLKCLKKLYRHIAVILVYEDSTMVAVTHSWGHTEVAVVHTDWEELVYSGNWIVKRIPVTNSRIIRAPIFTCTQMVKSLIGLDKWWVQTPFQLFKELEGGWDR